MNNAFREKRIKKHFNHTVLHIHILPDAAGTLFQRYILYKTSFLIQYELNGTEIDRN